MNALGLADLDRKLRRVRMAYRDLIRDWTEVLPTQSVCLQVPLALEEDHPESGLASPRPAHPEAARAQPRMRSKSLSQ